MSGIPRGIEVLVKKAAVDPEFKERLLRNRTGAAADIELELEPAEAMMLQVIPGSQLLTTIEQTTVPERQKPAAGGVPHAHGHVAVGATDRSWP